MKAKLSLLCNVTCCNGSMNIEIFDNDFSIFTGGNFESGALRIDLIINWPTTLNILTSNKSPDDTEMDTEGNIIKDKSIEVIGVLINDFPIHQDLLDKIFICRKDGVEHDTYENWWGFNGKIKLLLDKPNPMRYMLSLNNEFDLNRLHWNNDEQ